MALLASVKRLQCSLTPTTGRNTSLFVASPFSIQPRNNLSTLRTRVTRLNKQYNSQFLIKAYPQRFFHTSNAIWKDPVELKVAAAGAASAEEPKPITAAAIIIGTEILTGKVQDINTFFLAKFLFAQGIELQKVEVVPDVEEAIVETIHKLSPKYNFVFTSGGIGPTHDDITYGCIAKAFHKQLVYHEETLSKMKESINAPINEARKRMALIPQGSKILNTPDLWVPLVVVNNVHILPGVPQLFSKMLEANKDYFKSDTKFHRVLIVTKKPEGEIAVPLSHAQEEFPQCNIGSYPQLEPRQVIISFEGEEKDKEMVEEVANKVMKEIDAVRLPSGQQLPVGEKVEGGAPSTETNATMS